MLTRYKNKGIIILSLFALVALMLAPVQVSAAKKLSKNENKLCKMLADFQNDYLKDPDSFKILKVYKASYTYDASWDSDASWKEDKDIFDLVSKKYNYKVVYSAKNDFGGRVQDVIYFNLSTKAIWSPEKSSHEALYLVKNQVKVKNATVKLIQKQTKKYYNNL